MTFLFTADLLSILTCRIINLLRMQHFTANYSAFTAALLQNYLGTMEEGEGEEDREVGDGCEKRAQPQLELAGLRLLTD